MSSSTNIEQQWKKKILMGLALANKDIMHLFLFIFFFGFINNNQTSNVGES